MLLPKMFLQRDSRLSQQSSRLTSANLQAHTESTPTFRNFAFNYTGYHGDQPSNQSQSRAFVRGERFGMHRGPLRSHESESDSTDTPDSVAAMHGTQADDDLDSTITSASRFLAEANQDESRAFFDPYSAENAPQTPASVYTAASSVVSSGCDNANDTAPSLRIFGDFSLGDSNAFRLTNESRTTMRNQAENAIDSHRTQHVDMSNNAWPSAAFSRKRLPNESERERRGADDGAKRLLLGSCKTAELFKRSVSHQLPSALKPPDVLRTPPVVKSRPSLVFSAASTCTSWSPAPSPAPPFAASAKWDAGGQRFAFAQPHSPEESFAAPASPPSPFKQPANRAAQSDLQAKFKQFQRNSSLIEQFGAGLFGNGANEHQADDGSQLYQPVNAFIDQTRSSAEACCSPLQGTSYQIGVRTSAELHEFCSNKQLKRPDVYRSEAKRLKHYADSVTTLDQTGRNSAELHSTLVTLVKFGTYVEALLLFLLCAAAMLARPKRYKSEQCAEFYTGLLPMLNYLRQLAQSCRNADQSDDPVGLLDLGVHTICGLLDSQVHVHLFDCRKRSLESSLRKADELKGLLRRTKEPDCTSNGSTSSGYLSNLSSPLLHRNSDCSAAKEREDKFDLLCEQYESSLRDMALLCRAFELREEALQMLGELRNSSVLAQCEQRRQWKRITNVAKWPPLSSHQAPLDQLIAYVRTFTAALVNTVTGLLRQSAEPLSSSRSKR